MTAAKSTVIEFGTPREVLFSSTLPLEFADRLHTEEFRRYAER